MCDNCIIVTIYNWITVMRFYRYVIGQLNLYIMKIPNLLRFFMVYKLLVEVTDLWSNIH